MLSTPLPSRIRTSSLTLVPQGQASLESDLCLGTRVQGLERQRKSKLWTFRNTRTMTLYLLSTPLRGVGGFALPASSPFTQLPSTGLDFFTEM